MSVKTLLAKLCIFSLLLLMISPVGARPRARRKLPAGTGTQFLLQKADLKLKRLILALATSDLQLGIQELEDCLVLVEQVEDWAKAAGPLFNTPAMESGISNAREALLFSHFLMEAGLGTRRDLGQQVEHFLAQGRPPSEELSLLVAASQAAALAGRLEEARGFAGRAQRIEEGAAELSPVIRYAFRSSQFRIQRLEGQSFSAQEIVSRFKHATAPLDDYVPRTHPLHDVDWLLGREATAMWVDELADLGEVGLAPLGAIYDYNQQLKAALERGWDDKELQAMGFQWPYSAYLKLFASSVLVSTYLDQALSICEVLPPEQARRKMDAGQLQTLEKLLAELPKTGQLMVNPKFGPGYTEFAFAQRGLAAEMRGRARYLRARLSDDPEQKLKYLEEALTEIRKADDDVNLVRYLFRVAEMGKSLNRPQRVQQTLEEALSIAQRRELLLDVLRARELLADHHASGGNWTAVQTQCKAALAEIEDAIPLAGGSSQAAASLRQRSQRLSALMARAALAGEDAEGAMAALNLGRQYHTAVSKVGAEEAPAELPLVQAKTAELAMLTKKIESLEALPPSETRDEILEHSQKLLADSKAEFLLQSRQIRQQHSAKYSSVLRFDPLNLPDIQKNLPPGMGVVQYFPTEEQLFIFLVTGDQFRLRSHAVTLAELDKTVLGLSRSLRRVSKDTEHLDRTAKQLYSYLLAPIEADIAALDSLILVPTGRLHFVPYGALQDAQGRPFITQKSFLELAKPTDFLTLSDSQPGQVSSVVGFANATGDLPAASQEGKAITAMFAGSQLFEGQKATKRNFLEFGNQGKALHLATHGLWDVSNPLNNYLALAGEEKVSQEEIFRLSLENTALVTLSACNSAVSTEESADYVASLAEAFWIAGARTVVASLWSVDDDSTARLMTEFYTGLKAGKSKAAALRDAQLAVMSQPEFAHPYYWSGFVLFGDGR